MIELTMICLIGLIKNKIENIKNSMTIIGEAENPKIKNPRKSTQMINGTPKYPNALPTKTVPKMDIPILPRRNPLKLFKKSINPPVVPTIVLRQFYRINNRLL